MRDDCPKCGGPLRSIACPDGRAGCCVAHYGCPPCIAKRVREVAAKKMQDEIEAALRQANGIE